MKLNKQRMETTLLPIPMPETKEVSGQKHGKTMRIKTANDRQRITVNLLADGPTDPTQRSQVKR